VSDRLREITERLDAITRELRTGEIDDEGAAALTSEAAELAAEAAEETNRLIREAEPD
jgi:uncharacterized membrane-anchored protein